MELEKQVCSLELAKQLKELGVKQESVVGWRNTRPAAALPVFWHLKPGIASEEWIGEDAVAAFTVAELGEMLPKLAYINGDQTWYSGPQGSFEDDYIEGKLLAAKKQVWRWKASYNYSIGHEANTEADARAKMLIYLLENKLTQV